MAIKKNTTETNKNKKSWTNEFKPSQSFDEEIAIQITQEGLNKYKMELRKLIEFDRPAVLELLKEARTQGDLSENADYDASKEKQSEIENRILDLENIISRSVIIDVKKLSDKIVQLGDIVEYTKNNKIIKIQVVDSIESNPLDEIPKVSDKSPLGKAIIGKNIKTKVKVSAGKSFNIEILRIVKQ